MSKGLPRSLANSDRINVVERVIDLTGLVLSSVAAAGTGDQNQGLSTAVIGALPEADLLLLGAKAELAFAGPGSSADLSDVWEGDFSIGTAPDADGTLENDEVDILASTALTAAAEVTPSTRVVNATAAVLDNRDGSLELNLNLAIDAAAATGQDDGTSVDITLSGTVTVVYVVLGSQDV